MGLCWLVRTPHLAGSLKLATSDSLYLSNTQSYRSKASASREPAVKHLSAQSTFSQQLLCWEQPREGGRSSQVAWTLESLSGIGLRCLNTHPLLIKSNCKQGLSHEFFLGEFAQYCTSVSGARGDSCPGSLLPTMEKLALQRELRG